MFTRRHESTGMGTRCDNQKASKSAHEAQNAAEAAAESIGRKNNHDTRNRSSVRARSIEGERAGDHVGSGERVENPRHRSQADGALCPPADRYSARKTPALTGQAWIDYRYALEAAMSERRIERYVGHEHEAAENEQSKPDRKCPVARAQEKLTYKLL